MSEYERQFLASLVYDRKNMFQTTLTADYFTSSKTRGMFEALKQVIEIEELQPTILEVQRHCNLKAIDIHDIFDTPANAGNFRFYEEKIKEGYKKRLLTIILKKSLATIENETVDDAISNIDIEIENLHKNIDNTEIMTFKDHSDSFLSEMQERAKLNGSLQGLSTPWKTLNNYTLGLAEENLYIVAARPSEGKTAIAMNMINHLGLEENTAVGFLSIESPLKQMYDRLVSINANVNLSAIMACKLKEYEIIKIGDSVGNIKNSDIYIVDKADMTLSECLAQARRMHIKYDIKILFVDYIQKIQHGGNKKLSRWEQIAEISTAFKNLARQLKIPIVALAQLRRDAQNRRPNLADLADSSQLEKDADGIIFIYHKKSGEEVDSYLLFDKNRNGPTGDIPVYFNKPTLTFRERETNARSNNKE
jgi:replicative DNA helicase